MAIFDPRMLLLHIIEMVMLSILFGIGASWCWVLWNLLKGESLLPDRPLVERRKTPWSSGSVLLVFLLYIAANFLLFQGYMWLTGRPSADEKPVAPLSAPAAMVDKTPSPTAETAAARSTKDEHSDKSDHQPAVPDSEGPSRKEGKDFSLLEVMSVQATVNLLLLFLVPALLKRTSGALLHDFGLGLDHLGRQVFIGTVAILFLMPIIFATQYCAVKALGPVDEHFRHPVERMLREQFSGGVAGLAIFTAVVLAPMFEELMFRGIFQTWLIDLLDRFGGRLDSSAVAQPNSCGIVYITDEINVPAPARGIIESSESDDRPTSQQDEPAAPEAMDQEWVHKDWLPEEPKQDLPSHKLAVTQTASPISVGLAIVLTSLIFAMLHAGQWPAPIPIFILAIGLGLVYYRTGSLLAVVCMHAIFNGSSTLALIYALLVGEPGASEKKVPPPAVERTVPAQKVKSRLDDVAHRPQRGKTSIPHTFC
jgi:membrane protease YdiL (CAAX protease family)